MDIIIRFILEIGTTNESLSAWGLYKPQPVSKNE